MAGSKRMSFGKGALAAAMVSSAGLVSSPFGSGNPATGSGPHLKGITFAGSEAVKTMEK